MTIEERLTNLENLVNGLIKNMSNRNFYVNADINGCRHTEGNLTEVSEQNSSDLTDVRTAIEEVYEMITSE